jgi:hypothetical protein
MSDLWKHDPNAWVYESEAVEEITARGPVDAKEWVNAFVDAVARTPELARDRESMLCWFAGAIMTGHARGVANAADAGSEADGSKEKTLVESAEEGS